MLLNSSIPHVGLKSRSQLRYLEDRKDLEVAKPNFEPEGLQ